MGELLMPRKEKSWEKQIAEKDRLREEVSIIFTRDNLNYQSGKDAAKIAAEITGKNVEYLGVKEGFVRNTAMGEAQNFSVDGKEIYVVGFATVGIASDLIEKIRRKPTESVDLN